MATVQGQVCDEIVMKFLFGNRESSFKKKLC